MPADDNAWFFVGMYNRNGVLLFVLLSQPMSCSLALPVLAPTSTLQLAPRTTHCSDRYFANTESVGGDVESFARHARRSTVNADEYVHEPTLHLAQWPLTIETMTCLAA